ncbi:hypothetical protein BU24DRAFT_410859 [Aaosphaeria arxii CBS 175.79]|uniref:Rhodopsin domain-containing protein n=1 Tax=Aaosphaeria arxii CBS 175.79 TaxID=1450172 RepID=A0A6A5XR63_9PLEO|nr:uncharacterized protein BU24DRAFT_410859 [Aaosphaeria arxii CBS 175.79]KAF2015190.1 hypothetical protein BU24DRAFT_410859 [Aaosphaeria arxii CBS 175.79]
MYMQIFMYTILIAHAASVLGVPILGDQDIADTDNCPQAAFFLRYLFACGINFSIWWTNAMNIMTLCGDFNTILMALAISDFVCDTIILILPVPVVWELQMPTSQKIAVTGVFALGGFAVVASCIRMIWVVWQAKRVHKDIIAGFNVAKGPQSYQLRFYYINRIVRSSYREQKEQQLKPSKPGSEKVQRRITYDACGLK